MVGSSYFSYGTFSTNIQPNMRYGITLSARLAGMMMDIDRLGAIRVDSNNDKNAWVAFNAAQGPRHSANEHLVPESLFDSPQTVEKETNAYSAVKALQIAAQQGQKIFTITKENINIVLPQLQHKALIVEDIQNAVAAGKVVTISQKVISQNGWTGVGYSIVDLATGAVAYLIGGAADGGFAYALGLAAASMIVIALVGVLGTGGFGAAATAPFILGLIGPILVTFLMLLAIMAYKYKDDDFMKACFFGGLVFNLGLAMGELGKVYGAIGSFIGGYSAFNTWHQCYFPSNG